MEDIQALIRGGLAEMGLTAQAASPAPALLERYCRLLLEKNRVMNLTAITDPAPAARLHMLDSAALLECGRFEGKTLIDVGTGAGLPGMALKILCPALEVTLLDALSKRLEWLDETASALGLTGVSTLHARAEEAGRDPALRERFDFAAARAVAELRVLCELCLPFVKVGGRFLAMKGPDCGGEIDRAMPAIEALGGRLAGCHDYDVPGAGARHRVVVVEKAAPTPPRFPRRWARIQKAPL